MPSDPPEPLVLLPGTLCDARVFALLLARLPGVSARVPVLEGAETTAEMAERLLAGLPPRFALGGFSLGGILALEMIAWAPERVTRLALLDTTARPDLPERATERRNAVARAAELGLERYAGDKLWSLYVAEDGRADAANRALVAAMAVELGIEAFRRHSEFAILRADSRPRLPAIAVPTLVLCGEHDRLCPPALHREIAEAVPGSRLVVVPRAGHFALIERPDAVADAFRGWLAARSPVLEDAP